MNVLAYRLPGTVLLTLALLASGVSTAQETKGGGVNLLEGKDLTKNWTTKDAKLNDHDSGGIIPGIPPTKNTAKPAGEWNLMKVTVKGNKVTVELNGEVVNDVPLDHAKIKDRPPTGYIGSQDHGLPLWLRNIRVRELKNN